MSLPERIREHLDDAALLRQGDAVIVALSGGADSVALLHLLRFPLADRVSRLSAAHYDHRMRPGSAADADWVRGLCRAWSVPLQVGVAERAPRSEEEARTLRYDFLRSAADRFGAGRIATAHHADDQAETVLFRALRGTGPRGLAGIPPRRGPLIRPLLPVRRSEIEEYLASRRLRFRTDPTNRYAGYTRNRLRLEALPLLESMVPGAAGGLARLATLARRDEAAWSAILNTLSERVVLSREGGSIEVAREELLGYHPQVRSRLLRFLLREFDVNPGKRATEVALEFIAGGRSGAGIDLPGGVRLERFLDRFRIGRPQGKPPPERILEIAAPGEGKGMAAPGGREVIVWWTMSTSTAEDDDSVSFRPGDLHFPLIVRARRPGDRIRLPYGTKKLKKLFLEERVPGPVRERAVIVAEREARVLWVRGIARAAIPLPAAGEPVLTIRVQDA